MTRQLTKFCQFLVKTDSEALVVNPELRCLSRLLNFSCPLSPGPLPHPAIPLFFHSRSFSRLLGRSQRAFSLSYLRNSISVLRRARPNLRICRGENSSQKFLRATSSPSRAVRGNSHGKGQTKNQIGGFHVTFPRKRGSLYC